MFSLLAIHAPANKYLASQDLRRQAHDTLIRAKAHYHSSSSIVGKAISECVTDIMHAIDTPATTGAYIWQYIEGGGCVYFIFTPSRAHGCGVVRSCPRAEGVCDHVTNGRGVKRVSIL